MEIVLRLIIIVFILAPAFYASYWVWTKPINFQRTASSFIEKNFKAPFKEFVDKPLGDALKVSEDDTIYAEDGSEAGKVFGETNISNEIIIFPKIKSYNSINDFPMKVKWKSYRMQFIASEGSSSLYIGNAGEVAENNILINAKFKILSGQ